MNNFGYFTPLGRVLDADYTPATEEDLALEYERQHRELRRAFGLSEEAPTAISYLVGNWHKRAWSRRLTAFILRLLFGSVVFFLLALLVG